MDIIGTARRIERRLARSVDAAFGELIGKSPPSAIEIVHKVIDLAEQRVQEAGRGRRVFPFNRLLVHVLAPPEDPEARSRVEAMIEGPPSLTDRIRDRLREVGCDVDALSCHVDFQPAAGPAWGSPEFHVEFHRVVPKRPAARSGKALPPALRLTLLAGAAERRAYVFSGQRVDIGRGSAVLDRRRRVTRTNQVSFLEDDSEVNQTISRRHAHVTYTPVSSEYRICDDRSVHGTVVVRGGLTIPVPPGTRGVRLRSGDEILLGRGRLRVAIERSAAADGSPSSRRTR